MTLKLSPAEFRVLIDRGSLDNRLVAVIDDDGNAYVLAKMKALPPNIEEACYCFVVEADDKWMQELMALSKVMVYARSTPTFIEAAATFWPTDKCVQGLMLWGLPPCSKPS